MTNKAEADVARETTEAILTDKADKVYDAKANEANEWTSRRGRQAN